MDSIITHTVSTIVESCGTVPYREFVIAPICRLNVHSVSLWCRLERVKSMVAAAISDERMETLHDHDVVGEEMEMSEAVWKSEYCHHKVGPWLGSKT